MPQMECKPQPGQLVAADARHKPSLISDCTGNTLLSATNGNYSRYSQLSLTNHATPASNIVINLSTLPTGVEPLTPSTPMRHDAPAIVVDSADNQQTYLLMPPTGNDEIKRQDAAVAEPCDYYQTIKAKEMAEIEDIDKEDEDGNLLLSKYTSSHC